MQRKTSLRNVAIAMIAALGISVAPSANAVNGNNSLAAVLTAKSSFDKDPANFDILTAAVLAVLKAKPNSPVKVLTDGTVALTVFAPTDRAFKNLARSLTRKPVVSEEAAFKAVAGLGIDTVEQVLLYHVIPGATILSPDALKSNKAVLKTALTGKTIKVNVRGTSITLQDVGAGANPRVILALVDINKGNNQVAHGINAVLLPN